MTDDLELGHDSDLRTPPPAGALVVPTRGMEPLGTDAGFEVNTDAALFDSSFHDGEDAHARRFGLAIEHVKGSVRGRTFDNDVMRLRVGPGGFYAQSRRFEAAFYGDTGKATVSFVSEAEAAAIVWEAVAHYRSEEARSLLCVYSSDEAPDFFLGYRVSDDQRYEIGRLARVVPLHMRVLFSAAETVPLVGATSGAVVYQRTSTGKHVVVKAPGRRRPLMVGAGHH
ncbi:MAG: hypothetical protein KF875_01850 [Trueperaceae bacterium]|nr:hypothetical protein [Trueperaceae bacterium]MCO5172857.1 hypothetical protein [Trueperaceae bacterium]MCW5820201.1 hypothetical protein [Trueperaceae bacterium]